MARTWHHDRRRFHPWKSGPWPAYRTGWYHINYSSSPSYWRRANETKPRRREAHVLETRSRWNPTDEVWPWPLHRKPVNYFW